jgi:two-component system, NarL family, nitrate/nitrite response regulator NarL
MINLLLVDEQPAFSAGINSIFDEANSDIQVVGSVNTCKKALDFLEKNLVHILLLDPSITESLNNNCIERIKTEFNDVKIIILTNELDINYLNNLWMIGVDGIELKTCGKKGLFHIIKGVLEGKRMVGKEIPDFVNKSSFYKRKEEPKLSSKEEEIYQLMLSVNSYEEIAYKLKLPVVAVVFHGKNILKKISRNKSELTLKDLRKNQLAS